MFMDTVALKLIPVILLGLIAPGSAEQGSDPATVLEEQTKRRGQEGLARVGRDQTLDKLWFEQRLRLFDQRLNTVQRPKQRTRLNQSLDQIQRKETRQQSHLEQTLNNLELSQRNGDLRQKQELNQLRHRQRSAAFARRQKIKRQRNRLKGRGRNPRLK